jgi:ABC-type multidrug transport system ATPase subunit
MQIRLDGIGKRFHKEWIFRNVNLEFESKGKYAIVGNNGSGKSTLLQVIASIGIPTEGAIQFIDNGLTIEVEELIHFLSFSAPYQELPEELTGNELFDFHFKFRQKAIDFDSKAFFQMLQLEKQGDKLVKFYSSGMKQRMRLGFCMLTKAEVYMLDEPTTNLDKNGMAWYQQLIQNQLIDKLVIISSNIEEEYKFCNTIIKIEDYKSKK